MHFAKSIRPQLPQRPPFARQNDWTSHRARSRITLAATKQDGAEPHAGGWSNEKDTIRRSRCPQWVGRDEKNERYLHCAYCASGRRPEGFEYAAVPAGPALGAFFAGVSHLEAASVIAFRALAAELEGLAAPLKSAPHVTRSVTLGRSR